MQSEPWSEMLSCRFLSDLISDGFLVLDERLAVYHVNTLFTEMIGYSKTDILSHSLTEFVHESSKEILEATIRKSLDDHVSSLEIDWVARNGNLVPTTVQVGSVADPRNETRWGFIVINAQPTTDQPLTEDEARYRLVFENLADGVFQTDEDGIITISTAKGAEIFGYSVSELEGRNFGVLLHPDDLPAIFHAFGESRDRLETLPGGIEARGVRKDGSIIHFHVTNTVLVKDGKFRGFQTLLRNVTDRVEVVNDLRESEERFALFAEHPRTCLHKG
ncbi:MAG: PAS domain-containing protein [Candidatus Thorarchaeota archaeon]